MEKKEKEIY